MIEPFRNLSLIEVKNPVTVSNIDVNMFSKAGRYSRTMPNNRSRVGETIASGIASGLPGSVLFFAPLGSLKSTSSSARSRIASGLSGAFTTLMAASIFRRLSLLFGSMFKLCFSATFFADMSAFSNVKPLSR